MHFWHTRHAQRVCQKCMIGGLAEPGHRPPAALR